MIMKKEFKTYTISVQKMRPFIYHNPMTPSSSHTLLITTLQRLFGPLTDDCQKEMEAKKFHSNKPFHLSVTK